jgi:hypothetical protein
MALLLVTCLTGDAAAQALPNLSSARVAYTTRKNAVNPQGELKAQIDDIDKAMAAALQAGQNGEVRRLLAKGMTLLNGGAWTPALEYRHSLALRSERTVIDSAQPYRLRLEQIYAPAIDLSAALTARVSIRSRHVAADASATSTPSTASALGSFDSVSRDLREAPFAMDLNLTALADGAYAIEAEVFDAATSLGATSVEVTLQKGLDARLHALETAAAKLPESLRADVLYPVDYVRKVNQGRIGFGTFELATELAAADRIVASAKGGTDPFKGRVGDMERHYVLAGANEVMPYRVYVPTGIAPAPRRRW